MDYHTSNNGFWKNMGGVYTQTVEDLIRNNFDFQLNEYPIWNESKREYLNSLILNHYAMCEIGYETEGLWRRMLKAKMNELKFDLYRKIKCS